MDSTAQYSAAQADLDRNYELYETLGTGAFSEVKRAVHRLTGQTFAIKVIDRKKCIGKEQMIHSEIDILKKVQHPHIIQLFDLYETEHKIYLVMELVTGGELFDSIVARGHYTEVDAAKLVQKILLAVDYLHSRGIAHRDLKPENLLFYDKSTDSKIMVSDFGLSKIFNDEEAMKTACGTPGYVAPEVLRRQGYGREVDLWSLGVITFILLVGFPPFYSENNQELFQQIMRGDYEFESPHWDEISSHAKDFVSKLLVVDAQKRFTAKQALSHKFILKNCPPAPIDVQLMQDVVLSGLPSPLKAPPANLAQRVSQNLRSRGLSQSRRRSVDISKARNNMAGPHYAPPEPGSRRTSVQIASHEESSQAHPLAEDVIMEEPNGLQPKSEVQLKPSEVVDSGIVASSPSYEDGDREFLRQLSQVNHLINQGAMVPAYAMLQEIDCPYKLRKLYEDMIFNGSTTNGQSDDSLDKAHKSTLDRPREPESSTEQYISDLAKLVQKTKPLSYRVISAGASTQLVDTTYSQAHIIQPPATPTSKMSDSQKDDGSKKSNQSMNSAGMKKKDFFERIDMKVGKMLAFLTGTSRVQQE